MLGLRLTPFAYLLSRRHTFVTIKQGRWDHPVELFWLKLQWCTSIPRILQIDVNRDGTVCVLLGKMNIWIYYYLRVPQTFHLFTNYTIQQYISQICTCVVLLSWLWCSWYTYLVYSFALFTVASMVFKWYYSPIPVKSPLQWRHNGRGSVSNHQPHDQRKHQSSTSLLFIGDRWIPRTNGQ